MEDAADGRIYLPREWLEDAGAPTDAASFPGAEAAVFLVVSRLLDEADRYYASAEHGIARLPFRSAWAIVAARKVYGAIGETVRRRGAAAWERRAGTSTLAKLRMLVSSGFMAARAVRGGSRVAAPDRGELWTAPHEYQGGGDLRAGV